MFAEMLCNNLRMTFVLFFLRMIKLMIQLPFINEMTIEAEVTICFNHYNLCL